MKQHELFLSQALRKKFHQCETVYGAWLSIGSAEVASIFAAAKGHFVGIDMEHTTIEFSTAQAIIRACHQYQRPCLPRIFSATPESVRRLLDAGADGLIIPQIALRTQIDAILESMWYSPKGKRGFGVAAAQRYGRGFDDYVKLANESLSLMIQIETIEAVENIDALVSHPGVDAVMIGPYDISGSLGIPGELTHPRVVKASQAVIKACKKYGVSCGIHLVYPDTKEVSQKLEEGFHFLVIGSDIFNLWKRSEEVDAIIEQYGYRE